MKTLLRLLLLAVVLYGCSKGIAPSDTAKVQATFAKYPDSEGKQIFLDKCGKCHKYRIPEYYTAEKWPGIIDVMARKAKLNDGQKAAVLDFVKKHAKA